MKKLLALVLALVMSMSLVTISNAAFKDADKIDYKEAVDVMNAVGVFVGDEKGNFNAKENLTREQAAKIIAYMQLGKDKADSLKCTVAPFEDVAATRWSAGYIAYCVEQGIIDGMTETTFEPTGKLTGFQWAKMLLCAVGFGVKGEFTGSSWSVNTALVAHKVNLFAGDLDGADHTALRREQAALYAFNALSLIHI